MIKVALYYRIEASYINKALSSLKSLIDKDDNIIKLIK